MNYISISLITLLCGLSFLANAQYNTKENNVWIFGANAGLDFSTNPPKSITSRSGSFEGCASVCDSNGNILFYTEGSDSIWTINGTMPHADSLTSHNGIMYDAWSSTQAALIVPSGSNPHRYYVFSLEQGGLFINGSSGRLFYTLVDMSLNNGKGDVVAGERSVLIDSNLAEKMIAVPSADCAVWLLVHSNTLPIFKAYKIDRNGIRNTPIISSSGNFSTCCYAYSEGAMKISPDFKKLMVCSAYSSVDSLYTYWNYNSVGAEICDFNPATGVVSNALTLISKKSCYSGEFSADSKKLYVSVQDTLEATLAIAQFDLNNSNIPGSRTDLSIGKAQVFDMRLGPDGKIYAGNINNAPEGDSIDVINYPQLLGNQCQFTLNAFSLDSGTYCTYDFPNLYVQPKCLVGTENEDPIKLIQTFSIFPNPGIGSFTIDKTIDDHASVVIEVWNSQGRQVYTECVDHSSKQIHLNLNQNIPGLYLAKIIDGNTFYVLKFIIKQSSH